VSCLDEVRRWVLECEEHATVIAPEPLKPSLEKFAWALTDKYREMEEMAA
jgi:hypothetical protein